MKDNEGNTMISLKDIGWGLVILSFILLFLLSTTSGPVQWVVPGVFVVGFAMVVVNGVKGGR
jgi:TRAP-type mannitol/chloroaromatic compound transport system permease small subunit